ncbi:ABC transporter ATP-binding protein [Microvirga sp. TS319]|uniref:ABC transporter ATP-binding protein n=1 Tax=Microvirga sp. TS319 TaxID=3241165 RepID=UPI00351A84A4
MTETATALIQRRTGSSALVLDHVSKAYATEDGGVLAVADISIKVPEGEFLSIIGPSGCGKSTLFRILGGLVDDWSGMVLVNGKPVATADRAIGMVFQEDSTFPWRTVLENVEFPLEVAGVGKAERRERARYFLELVGLHGFENRYPAQLSGGMRQRTAIARTLAYEPRILLMDEPFAALDEQTRLLLGDKVLQLHSKLNQTTVLITHNITEAVQLSDRVAIMTYRPGRIKRMLDINLPRPRSSEIVSSEQFGRYVASIWGDLREEASKGLAASER